MLPTMAPRFPIRAAFIKSAPPGPCSPIMYVVIIIPMPKDVPRLVRAGSWYFLKKHRKPESSASVRIAGLSDR